MKFCRNCGAALPENAVVCPKCGVPVTNSNAATGTSTSSSLPDTGSFAWAFTGIFIPLVGLILFLVWHRNSPKNANSAGLGALIGVVFEIVFMASIAIINAVAGK